MKSMMVLLALASMSLCACALDGTPPEALSSESSQASAEANDPRCGDLYRALEDCEARETHYDADGNRIQQFVCVDETYAWTSCKNARPSFAQARPDVEAKPNDSLDAVPVMAMPIITVPQ